MAIVGGASGNFSSSRPVPFGIGDIYAFGTEQHVCIEAGYGLLEWGSSKATAVEVFNNANGLEGVAMVLDGQSGVIQN